MTLSSVNLFGCCGTFGPSRNHGGLYQCSPKEAPRDQLVAQRALQVIRRVRAHDDNGVQGQAEYVEDGPLLGIGDVPGTQRPGHRLEETNAEFHHQEGSKNHVLTVQRHVGHGGTVGSEAKDWNGHAQARQEVHKGGTDFGGLFLRAGDFRYQVLQEWVDESTDGNGHHE